MTDYTLTTPRIAAYERHLLNEERSRGTIEKYLRDVNAFSAWLGGRQVTKELASEWKAHLLSSGYAPVSVNAMLSALNGLFRFLGWDECRLKFLKIQRRLFRDGRRELTKNEYERLVSTASALGKERLALLMEAVCATGIRISELNRLTVEAAKRGRAEISLKGKIREILLPGKLCRKLLKYAKKRKNRLRRDISHQKRKGDKPPSGLDGNEGPLRRRKRGAVKGLPPQPAPPFRHCILPRLQGHRTPGRHPRPFEHRDDQDIPRRPRFGVHASTGQARADIVGQNQHFAKEPGPVQLC